MITISEFKKNEYLFMNNPLFLFDLISSKNYTLLKYAIKKHPRSLIKNQMIHTVANNKYRFNLIHFALYHNDMTAVRMILKQNINVLRLKYDCFSDESANITGIYSHISCLFEHLNHNSKKILLNLFTKNRYAFEVDLYDLFIQDSSWLLNMIKHDFFELIKEMANHINISDVYKQNKSSDFFNLLLRNTNDSNLRILNYLFKFNPTYFGVCDYMEIEYIVNKLKLGKFLTKKEYFNYKNMITIMKELGTPFLDVITKMDLIDIQLE